MSKLSMNQWLLMNTKISDFRVADNCNLMMKTDQIVAHRFYKFLEIRKSIIIVHVYVGDTFALGNDL
jgi:hypothetical protein